MLTWCEMTPAERGAEDAEVKRIAAELSAEPAVVAVRKAIAAIAAAKRRESIEPFIIRSAVN